MKHRRPSMSRPSRKARALVGLGAIAASTVGVLGVTSAPALADATHCVGAVETPGAFACYTSPRFNQSGFQQFDVMEFPIVCYGVGCTGSVLWLYRPNDDYIGGRFTTVSYLGHTYTIYRPADSQPYILLSDNPKLDPITQAEVMALSMSLDAANGL